MAGNDLLRSRADAAVLSRDFGLAVRLYSTILQQSPDDVELLEKLGSIYVKSGDDKKALPYYTKVNKLKPNDFNTLNSLGGIYRRLKDYENSIAVLKQALTLNKNVDQVNYNLGFTYKFMEKYDEAVDCFETVIQMNPNDVLAYNHLGTIYQKRGENRTAIQTFLKGLKVDRNHPILHLNLAKSYENENQIQNAIIEYEAALRSKPGWNEAISDYSKLLLKLNKTKEAKELVSQALAVDPQNVKMHSTLGTIYSSQSDYEKSAVEFKKVLETEPENRYALEGLAESLEENGNYIQAVEYIERAEKANPDDVRLIKKSASANLSANRVSTASAKIKTLLDKNKEDVEALDLAGQLFIVKNDDAKAANFYKKIQELNPEYVQHWLKAAKRYRQVGKLEKAEGSIKRYIQKKPDDSKALTNLALISESLGKTNEALANFKKALQIDANNVTAKNALKRISEHITDIDKEAHLEDYAEDNPAAVDADSQMFDAENQDDESLIRTKIAEDTALVDNESSSTDSDLWKSESWDADQLVEENEDPFSLLDGNDESVLTGPGGTPIEPETEDLPENIPEDVKPNPIQSLDSLADAGNAGGNIAADGMEAEDLFNGFDNPELAEPEEKVKPQEDIKPANPKPASEPDETAGLTDNDFGLDAMAEDQFEEKPSAFDNANNSSKERKPPVTDNPSMDNDVFDDGMSDFDSLDTSSPLPSDDIPDSLQFDDFPEENNSITPEPEYQEMPRNNIPQQSSSGISGQEAERLMASMKKAQADAEKAMAAAEKAWIAANHAADAAQVVSEPKVDLTEMATDAVMQAAEKVRIEAEEIAREATDKALADRMDKIDAILPHFEQMLEDKDTVPDEDDERTQNALKLFKSLKALGESLPGEARTNFMQSASRMRMDYIISRLSGRDGLLKISQRLRDSGQIENCVREEEVPVSYKGKRLAADVLKNMTGFAKCLEDKDLSIGLEKIIAGVLRKLN